MTIASFARWLTNESPSFTRAVASRDGRSVVAAADRGGIWVFDAHWEPDKRRSGAGPGDAIGASDARADAADGEAGLGFRVRAAGTPATLGADRISAGGPRFRLN